MVEIDGSSGEGGGQMLRTSLAIAAATRQAFRITNIRARRPKPGLRAQHLAALQAAGKISQAEILGASLGSQEVTFRPKAIKPGVYRFDIRTAGSTTLVLQTIFIPLSMADAASQTTVTGGTHVRWSPSFHYLAWHWLLFMQRIGYEVELALDLAGYYPKGGGRIHAKYRPVGTPAPLHLLERGQMVGVHGLSMVSNLPMHIAQRQRSQAIHRLKDLDCIIEIDVQSLPAQAKGTALILLAKFEHSQVCYFGLGGRGKPAEQVADEAADALLAFLRTDGAVDEYLADQLLLPLSISDKVSEFRTARVTQHLLTNATVLQAFLHVEVEVYGALGEPGTVRIVPKFDCTVTGSA
jgi:RNA 3'-terminal phosphate cyclase (ATP)